MNFFAQQPAPQTNSCHLRRFDAKYRQLMQAIGRRCTVYVVLQDAPEWAWQPKYFQTLANAQWAQLDELAKAALDGRPRLKLFIVCASLDQPAGRSGRSKSAQQR
jgi:hypothetical protein